MADRDGSGRWRKGGASPNPGGRPKEVGDVRELAKGYTEAAVKTLAEIMNNTESPPAARTAAACALLDRAYGRPAQSVEARLAVSGVADTAAEVLMRLTAAARAAKAIDVTPVMVAEE
jgi:hypothetical protein